MIGQRFVASWKRLVPVKVHLLVVVVVVMQHS
jgi:hypothetical protein